MPYTLRAKRSGLTPLMHYRIMQRDAWTCQYCGDHATEIDHILPVSQGGKNRDKNLVACCRKCNLKARVRIFGSFEEKKRYILMKRFNPRGKLYKGEEE
jgi:5-methylcytosine-specific restriction endonuclease McrA